MKRIKNIYSLIYDFENLFEAYKRARQGKQEREDVMEFTDKLEDSLIELQNAFIWMIYKVGPYKIFYVFEPKKRLIMALQFRDRVAQHAIYAVLNPYFEKQYISDSYACRKGKGTHRAVKRLHDWVKQADRRSETWYYLKIDVTKYFYRIDHKILMSILEDKIADRRTLSLLSEIINCEDTNFGLPLAADIEKVSIDEMLGDVGLPVGNLTSQMFANLYLNELDQYCRHILGVKHFIRYNDDVIILHSDKKFLSAVKDDIEIFLDERLHLKLNNKTCIRPIRSGIEFVGFRIWPTHLKIRKKTARKIRKRLRYLYGLYHAGDIERDVLNRSIASYKGLMAHFDSYGFTNGLNELYVKEGIKCIEDREQETTA